MSLPTIDEALETLDLERPRNNKIPCPACGSEQTPALHVYEDHFYCYSCGKSGDGVGLIALYTGQDPRAVLKQYGGGKRAFRVQPKMAAIDVDKAVLRKYRQLHDWWFGELHRIYADSQLWAFERALDLYSDVFDSLRARMEGYDGYEAPQLPYAQEAEIVAVKAELERALPFEEKAARNARQT